MLKACLAQCVASLMIERRYPKAASIVFRASREISDYVGRSHLHKSLQPIENKNTSRTSHTILPTRYPSIHLKNPPHPPTSPHQPTYPPPLPSPPPNSKTMLLIGLTGSLATGKSTVSRLLSQPPYSLPIIDADLLARQVVEPGTLGYRRIVAHFGPTTPDLLLPPSSPDYAEDNDGKWEDKGKGKGKGKGRPINRAVLGRRVFGDSSERQHDRKILNSIVHPLVRLAIARSILYYYIHFHWAVILDIPLLYESRLDIFCSVVIMVAVSDPAVQMQRLRERDKNLSEEEARSRVASQMGVGEKVGRTRARGGGGGGGW